MTGLAGAIVTTLAGSALYAVSLSTLFGAAFITAGASHAGATDILLGGTSLIALVIEAVGVTLAGTVTSVLATRSAIASPRWWPPLLAGLATSAAYWGLAIASASGDGLMMLYMWPTHLESWLWVVAAQVVAVNLTARIAAVKIPTA